MEKNWKDELLETNQVLVKKHNGKIFYEIGNEITTDIAEAVAIMIRYDIGDDFIWEMRTEYDPEDIHTQKCLYWLTGGKSEWSTLNNYTKSWHKCNYLFQNQFEDIILDILKESKNLKDIKNGFTEHLNLPILYDFAISQGLIK